MKRVILLFVIFLPFYAIGQVRYEPGYFISNNGSRTECLIRDMGWLNNPVEFQYKLGENGAEQTAGVADVKEFGVTIEIPLGLRHYFFAGPQTSVFVNGLLVSDIPVKYELIWSQTLNYKANYPSLSFAAGAGVRFGKFSVEARKYFTRRVLDNADRFFFAYNKVSVMVGYRIK